MFVTTMDNNWLHLYPPFRRRLMAVIAEVERLTGEEWEMVEGFRSQARQTWLYAQGRTRPGDKVTWKKTPTWHGGGLAGDCRPERVRREGYDAILSRMWNTYYNTLSRHGLSNPAWSAGDKQHCQLTNSAMSREGKRWAAAGFPALPEDNTVSTKREEFPCLFVEGKTEESYIEGGEGWVQLRPVMEQFGLKGSADEQSATLHRGHQPVIIKPPMYRFESGKGYVRLGALKPFGIEAGFGKVLTLTQT